MRTLVVVGSVAFDTIETPGGTRDDVLGGSATLLRRRGELLRARAARRRRRRATSRRRELDVPRSGAASTSSGLEVATGHDLPLERALPRGHERPRHAGPRAQRVRRLPAEAARRAIRDAPVRLPRQHRSEPAERVLEQVERAALWSAADTMNLWIDERARRRSSALLRACRPAHHQRRGGAPCSRGEQQHRPRRRGRSCELGPKSVLIKRGEYGVLLFSGDSVFAVRRIPLEEVFDPTGAGDTLRGRLHGLPRARPATSRRPGLRRAIVYGSVMASFVVEDFSLERLRDADARRHRAPLPPVRRA